MRWGWASFFIFATAGAGTFKLILDVSGPVAVGVGIVTGSLMGFQGRAGGLAMPKKLRYDSRKGS